MERLPSPEHEQPERNDLEQAAEKVQERSVIYSIGGVSEGVARNVLAARTYHGIRDPEIPAVILVTPQEYESYREYAEQAGVEKFPDYYNPRMTSQGHVTTYMGIEGFPGRTLDEYIFEQVNESSPRYSAPQEGELGIAIQERVKQIQVESKEKIILLWSQIDRTTQNALKLLAESLVIYNTNRYTSKASFYEVIKQYSSFENAERDSIERLDWIIHTQVDNEGDLGYGVYRVYRQPLREALRELGALGSAD